MPSMLSLDELKETLSYKYSNEVLQTSRVRRAFNIDAFMGINREGLEFENKERRLCLHVTQYGEEISIQYPGKESLQAIPMMYDFRPKVKLADGTMMDDFSFGQIWDVFEIIGKKYNEFLSFVSSIVYDMGYMQKYILENNTYEYEELYIENGRIKDITKGKENLEWYKIGLDEDVWFTLNDRIGLLELDNGQKVSIEAFIMMVDLLFQNEDCKYFYKKAVLDGDTNYRSQLKNGRNSSSHSNLYMLNYLQGNEKVSSLVNAFQKGRGVASFKKQDYSIVTNGMVINVSVDERN